MAWTDAFSSFRPTRPTRQRDVGQAQTLVSVGSSDTSDTSDMKTRTGKLLSLWWTPWARLGTGELPTVTVQTNGHVIHRYSDGTTRFVGHVDAPSVPASMLPSWRASIEARAKREKQGKTASETTHRNVPRILKEAV